MNKAVKKQVAIGKTLMKKYWYTFRALAKPVLTSALIVGALLFAAPSSKAQPITAASLRVITINGPIDDFTAARVSAQLKAFDETGHEEIEMNITSYGGSVYAGLRIVGSMESIKSPVKTVCEGHCMSMATYILASGEPGRRFALPYTTILLHEVSGGSIGTLQTMKNDVGEAERLQNLLTQILSKHTGIGTTELTKLMDHDNYLSVEEALKYNIIDFVKGKNG